MVNQQQITACFITKDAVYPPEILSHVEAYGFNEILVRTDCDSPHRKQELFRAARNPFIYYQDDDCIAPIYQLLRLSQPSIITCAMKTTHIESYRNSRIALLGWGSVFPKSAIEVLDKYRAVHGEDHVYRRETERIMTWFNYPQQRLPLPIVDLPSAYAPDRLSYQPDHYDFIQIVEERCAIIEAATETSV